MVRRSRAASGIFRDSFHCTLYARTLTTAWLKQKRHLARSVSKFGFIAARSSTQRRPWPAVPARIQSMKRAWANASDGLAPDASAKVVADRMVEGRGARTVKGLPVGDCQLPIEKTGRVEDLNRQSEIGNRK